MLLQLVNNTLKKKKKVTLVFYTTEGFPAGLSAWERTNRKREILDSTFELIFCNEKINQRLNKSHIQKAREMYFNMIALLVENINLKGSQFCKEKNPLFILI